MIRMRNSSAMDFREVSSRVGAPVLGLSVSIFMMVQQSDHSSHAMLSPSLRKGSDTGPRREGRVKGYGCVAASHASCALVIASGITAPMLLRSNAPRQRSAKRVAVC